MINRLSHQPRSINQVGEEWLTEKCRHRPRTIPEAHQLNRDWSNGPVLLAFLKNLRPLRRTKEDNWLRCNASMILLWPQIKKSSLLARQPSQTREGTPSIRTIWAVPFSLPTTSCITPARKPSQSTPNRPLTSIKSNINLKTKSSPRNTPKTFSRNPKE